MAIGITANKYNSTMSVLAMLASEEILGKCATVVALVALILENKIKCARKRDNHFISPKNRLKLYARDGFKCIYCGTSEDPSLDHIVPQKVRIDHSEENLVTCCRPCNSSKGHKPLVEFIQYLHVTGKNTNITAKQVIEQAKKACI